MSGGITHAQIFSSFYIFLDILFFYYYQKEGEKLSFDSWDSWHGTIVILAVERRTWNV